MPSDALLEDAVHLLQHMAQALVLGHPAGQGDLKQVGLVPQDYAQHSWRGLCRPPPPTLTPDPEAQVLPPGRGLA